MNRGLIVYLLVGRMFLLLKTPKYYKCLEQMFEDAISRLMGGVTFLSLLGLPHSPPMSLDSETKFFHWWVSI